MKKILVAEDEINMLASINLILKRAGYEVIKAANGAEALAVISESEKDSINLIITDINMPYFSGMELIHTVKRSGIDIPVIVISGFLDRDMKASLFELEVAAVIDKPFDAQVLVDEVRKAVK